MVASFLFFFTRFNEVVTLIPIVGMLAYLVHGYANQNQLTPNYILVLFIVSVLATAWALATMVRHDSTKRSAHFVAFIDLCFVGALIAGVYELKNVDKANCVAISGGVNIVGNVITGFDINYTPFNITAFKTCALLKASFALGIINIIFFFATFVLAWMMYRREQVVVKETVVTSRRRSHDSRRGHSRSGTRHRSSSRSYRV